MNPTNYNALTPTDLGAQLEREGFLTRWNAEDRLELFQFWGGYRYLAPYTERSTGETFESIEEAHRYVFAL